LRLTVIGLPGGTPASITITGPNGFSQPATVSQSFTQLTPGMYTIAASTVTISTAQYSPSPANQTVAIGGSQISATVIYSQATGSLNITVTGLGTEKSAAVTVTGPGYTRDIRGTTLLNGLNPGSYVVTARDTVASGGTPHTASPASQTVTVAAQATATAGVSYTAPPADGTVNLRIAGLYLTQSAQTADGVVPLVRNRNGYLRVFVVADRGNSAAPAVTVRFYSNSVQVHSQTILAPAVGVPTSINESSLSYSWNVPVAGTLIQPNLSIQAEVDPAGAVLELDESDNVYPAATPLAMDVRTVPTLRVTLVPIVQTATGLQGDVTETNKNSFLDMTRRMHPVDAVDVVVGQPFPTANTLEADGTGWEDLLSDFDAASAADGRYYYGVVKVSYSAGVAGIAYVSQGTANAHTAIGWDYPNSNGVVMAHELAHNWGRNHAPCGGPANPDPAYPQADGSIGSYGVDVAAPTAVKPSNMGDIMGYCDPKWIGDYTYRGVMNYRIAHPLVVGGTGTVQPALLVWGRIRDGELLLEPAFQINARPRLPSHSGPYSVQGRAADGSTLFNLSFTPNEVADGKGNQQHFAFAIPMPPAKAARLASLRLTAPGREIVRQAQASIQPDSVQLRRIGGNRVALRWNGTAHPTVMVRDVETGQVLSFARGGSAELFTTKNQVDVVLSDGVQSRSRRMQVAR
jgi:hypothetical protein